MSAPLEMLKGVRIVSFTQFLLGPMGVQYLADMGAEVIKIEPPGTGAFERSWAGGETFPEGVSAFFLLANRNARSVTLNLKSPRGQEIARQLIETADVVVENFRPGVMERFGLDYESLRAIKPDLVYASASGYGGDSPYRDLPGQDLLIQAMTGLPSITGWQGCAPVPAGAPVVDQHGASLLAMAILGALFHHQRTGAGQKVEVTMVQAALDLQTEPLVYWLNGGKVETPGERIGSAFHRAPYGFYETEDGHLALSMSPVRQIRDALGGAPELEPFEDETTALERRDEIWRALNPIMRRRTTSAWVELLRAHGVWCAPVQAYEDVVTDPIVAHLDPFLEIDHPEAGPIRLVKHPVRYGSGTPEVRQMPPRLGEHTDETLAELGCSPEAIAELRRDGIV
ncbi:MAG: L-carnitine dehydratase/bile acid-inducible protein [Conexibacter sp.]|nr:L-carnitine dehydratase/bile acid-inducible protein [Conexibacter sp.]